TLAGSMLSGPVKGFESQPEESKWKFLGRQLLDRKGCLNCHKVTENGKPLTLTPITRGGVALSTNPTAGCLSDRPDTAKIPIYPLSDESRSALRGFVQTDFRPRGPDTVINDSRAAMKRFMCLNCHSKDGEG